MIMLPNDARAKLHHLSKVGVDPSIHAFACSIDDCQIGDFSGVKIIAKIGSIALFQAEAFGVQDAALTVALRMTIRVVQHMLVKRYHLAPEHVSNVLDHAANSGNFLEDDQIAEIFAAEVAMFITGAYPMSPENDWQAKLPPFDYRYAHPVRVALSNQIATEIGVLLEDCQRRWRDG